MRSDFGFVRMERIMALMVDGEEAPHQHVRRKGPYVEKVMFVCAQVLTRWSPTARKWWDGKLGIPPCGHWRWGSECKCQKAGWNKTLED
jgi:hypothetical protein